MQLKPWVRSTLFLIIINTLFIISPILYNKLRSLTTISNSVLANKAEKRTNKNSSNEKYSNCLKTEYQETKFAEKVDEKISELDNYIKQKYNVSVKYKNLVTGFEYDYNPTEIYYAASTIKLLDSIYLYEKAAKNELGLEEQLVYTSRFVCTNSEGLKQYNIGDKISLRKLVEYAIIYSDNSAHQMLIDYIGYDNLKDFGQSLGAINTLTSGDNFGNISSFDAIVYLEETYKFINENKVLGSELKNYLINAQDNYLKYDGLNVDVAHKYGEYDEYYHDIGIVYEKQPYAIAILTRHGNDNYKDIVNDLSKRINDFHHELKNINKKACKKS